MKSLVLGIMIASVSVSFAQTDDAPTHQLKKNFSVKQKMAVNPAAANSHDNVEYQLPLNTTSEKVIGVVHIINGAPVIYSMEKTINQRMIPENLPKAMAIDGQKIHFKYTISKTEMVHDGLPAVLVKLNDVSIAPK